MPRAAAIGDEEYTIETEPTPLPREVPAPVREPVPDREKVPA